MMANADVFSADACCFLVWQPWNACDKKACDWNERGWDPDGCTVGECQEILEERTDAAERMLKVRFVDVERTRG